MVNSTIWDEPISADISGQTAIFGLKSATYRLCLTWPACEFSQTDCYNLVTSQILCFSLTLI